MLERYLTDFREYPALDRAWRELNHDLEILEQKLDLDLDRRRVEQEEPEAEPVPEERQQPPAEEKPPGDAREAQAVEAAASSEREQPPISSMIELRGESIRRRKELAAPGGALALNEQRDLVLRRLCRDYEEALNRVAVAEEGLRRIFGYEVLSPLSSWSETLGGSITSCAIWTRNAMEWLGLYQQKEEAFTRTFSVRALMNRNAWGQLRHARDSFSVRLQILAELFQGFDNCRFRGVSASLIGEAGTVPWSAAFRGAALGAARLVTARSAAPPPRPSPPPPGRPPGRIVQSPPQPASGVPGTTARRCPPSPWGSRSGGSPCRRTRSGAPSASSRPAPKGSGEVSAGPPPSAPPTSGNTPGVTHGKDAVDQPGLPGQRAHSRQVHLRWRQHEP